ncbi:hypothetical protein CFP56_006423 [Quercus suber]|uniref:Uncharacterized protein n=1 Tax=Quercus suber TaxID=58331 RepID=A0AAW0IFA5_QUESU
MSSCRYLQFSPDSKLWPWKPPLRFLLGLKVNPKYFWILVVVEDVEKRKICIKKKKKKKTISEKTSVTFKHTHHSHSLNPKTQLRSLSLSFALIFVFNGGSNGEVGIGVRLVDQGRQRPEHGNRPTTAAALRTSPHARIGGGGRPLHRRPPHQRLSRFRHRVCRRQLRHRLRRDLCCRGYVCLVLSLEPLKGGGGNGVESKRKKEHVEEGIAADLRPPSIGDCRRMWRIRDSSGAGEQR